MLIEVQQILSGFAVPFNKGILKKKFKGSLPWFYCDPFIAGNCTEL